MEEKDQFGDSGWVSTFVFITGLVVGAVAALLLAPESGSLRV